LLDFYAADRKIARVLVAGAMIPPDGGRAVPLTIDFLQRTGAIIAREQSAGRLAAYPPLELALQCFNLYLGAVLTVVNHFGNASDAKSTLERALEVHLLGLRRSPQRRRRA
jgi:hypothetical protein